MFNNFNKNSASTSEIKKLENQFEQQHEILVNEGIMRVIDILPEKIKTEVPVVFLRGWATTVEVYKYNIISLAQNGRRVLAINAPYGIDSINISELSVSTKQKIHDIELRKIAALLKTLDEKNIKQVNVVAHSEGAIYGSITASLRPDKFRHIVLVDPAGMVGNYTTVGLIWGAVLDIALQTIRIFKKIFTKEGFMAFKQLLITIKVIARVFVLNPIHIIKSIQVIARTQIHEVLKTLNELGIKISIIHAIDDKFFPIEKVQQQIIEKTIHKFYTTHGTHHQICLYPEQYNRLINNALDEF